MSLCVCVSGGLASLFLDLAEELLALQDMGSQSFACRLLVEPFAKLWASLPALCRRRCENGVDVLDLEMERTRPTKRVFLLPLLVLCLRV